MGSEGDGVWARCEGVQGQEIPLMEQVWCMREGPGRFPSVGASAIALTPLFVYVI